MPEPIETLSLKEVLKRYDDPFYRVEVAGLSYRPTVPELLVLLQTVYAGGMVVEVQDAEAGLQFFDPGRQTPVGWIIPNPLRPGGKP